MHRYTPWLLSFSMLCCIHQLIAQPVAPAHVSTLSLAERQQRVTEICNELDTLIPQYNRKTLLLPIGISAGLFFNFFGIIASLDPQLQLDRLTTMKLLLTGNICWFITYLTCNGIYTRCDQICTLLGELRFLGPEGYKNFYPYLTRFNINETDFWDLHHASQHQSRLLQTYFMLKKQPSLYLF